MTAASIGPGSATPLQAPTADQPQVRAPQLDGLRGCAVLFVLIFHLIPRPFDNSPLGWMGVRLFFVLSGFLITGILLRARDRVRSGAQGAGFALRQFYTRRVLRIFPIYYLMLLILFAFNAEEVRTKILWHLGYLSNVRFVIDDYFARWVGHFWTLSIEEQFYLVWPVVILFTPRKALLPVLIAAVISGPVYRLASQLFAFSGMACEVLLPACSDTLAAGALMAAFLHKPGAWPRHKQKCAMAGWIGFGVFAALQTLDSCGLGSVPGFVVITCAFATGAAGLIAHAAFGSSGRLRPILEFKPLVYLGTISYGLYIYHEIVSTAVDTLAESGSLRLAVWALIALKFSLTGLAAALSWHFFEKPITGLKRFFPYDSSSASPAGRPSSAPLISTPSPT